MPDPCPIALRVVQFGQLATMGIVATAGPGFVGTFVLAVQRYQEEGEEDNRKLEEEEKRQEKTRERGGYRYPDEDEQ